MRRAVGLQGQGDDDEDGGPGHAVVVRGREEGGEGAHEGRLGEEREGRVEGVEVVVDEGDEVVEGGQPEEGRRV